jgi:hypothetical protein
VIPALGSWKRENGEFQSSLAYIVLKNKTRQDKNKQKCTVTDKGHRVSCRFDKNLLEVDSGDF